jgi:hypothetical protein
MPDSQPTPYGAVDALIESEFRFAATMLERALHALDKGAVAEAREYIMRARSCYLVAVQHIPRASRQDEAHLADLELDCEIIDNALRAMERMAESTLTA